MNIAADRPFHDRVSLTPHPKAVAARFPLFAPTAPSAFPTVLNVLPGIPAQPMEA
ncbi:hypothetical protein [Herbidospora mongoliensis]|uniref:hypothetical protein n=1 Tax=Herbidospora mongoliensis TaxID=688067 RepID=UPI000AC00E3F|nr:hypothetical protein [Herbidospora mongoliensis]